MNKILKRDEYIQEVYTPMMEEKEYEELVTINEGLFKTLFGMAKNLFKRDWASINGDPELIKKYKELDDRLTGFSTMKLSKKDICNKIRQELVDFAGDWYDKKINDAKKSETDPKPAKSMEFKDETLRSNLENIKDKINTIAGDDEQMKKWANILMNDMKTVINRVILDDMKDEEAKKELEKQIEEDLKDPDKVNQIMEEWQNRQMTELKKEQEKYISDTKSTPIKEDLLGDKAIQNIFGDYKGIIDADENVKSQFYKNDKTLGLNSIYTKDDYNNSDAFKEAAKLMDSFYTALNDNKIIDKFKETPGRSVQAMCIAVNAFIKQCAYGGTDYGTSLPLMAKCAIISNDLVSYKLPAGEDDANGEPTNYFTNLANAIVDGKFKDSKKKPIETSQDFKKNAKMLFNKIKDEAKKLKETSEKKYNEFAKKINFDTNKKESV